MKLGEFFVSVLVDASKGNLEVGGLVTRFKQLDVSALASIGTLGAVAGAIESMSVSAMDTAVSLESFHIATGLSTQELQRFQAAGAGVGLSGAQVAGAVDSIQMQLQQFRQFGTGSFAGMGQFLSSINVGFRPDAMRDAFSFMKELRRLSGEMRPEQYATMMQYLGRKDLLVLLSQANSSFDTLHNNSETLSNRQRESLRQQSVALTKMSNSWKAVGWVVSDMVAKPMTSVGNHLAKNIKFMVELAKHSEIVRMEMAGTGIAILAWVNPLTALVASLLLLQENWDETKEWWSNLPQNLSDAGKNLTSKLGDTRMPLETAAGMMGPGGGTYNQPSTEIQFTIYDKTSGGTNIEMTRKQQQQRAEELRKRHRAVELHQRGPTSPTKK